MPSSLNSILVKMRLEPLALPNLRDGTATDDRRWRSEAGNEQMRQILRLGLVLAALLGLFAQTTAFAAGPSFAAAIQNVPAETMPIDCPEMMEGRGENSLPCEQMTLGCIAAMGCMTVFTLDNRGTAVASTTPVASPVGRALLAALQGRSVEPEPHPPSTLDR